MNRALIALLLLGGVLPAVAAPPPPPPLPTFAGRDQVLLGRVYWRKDGATQPVARFGLVLSGKSSTQPVALASPEAGDATVTWAVRRDGDDAAAVSWTLQPQAGGSLAEASGRLKLQEGSVGHVALGSGAGGELFASLETGRASAFHVQRLWDHFGVVTEPQRLPASSAWTPPASAAAAAPQAPRPATFTVSCGSGLTFDLATNSGDGRCELDLDGERVAGGSCDDGAGNSARVSCTVGGKGSCLSITGRGSCLVR